LIGAEEGFNIRLVQKKALFDWFRRLYLIGSEGFI
jgi:hypothetical protein